MPPKSIATYFKPAGAAGVAGAAAVSPAASRKRVAEPAAAPLAPAKKTKATPAKATKAKPGSAVGQVPTIALPAATTRAQLKKALVEHPDTEALLSLELESIGEDWLLALQDELTKPYFLKIKEQLAQEKKAKAKVFPPEDDIYSWTRFCPLKDVRVIVVGQDPYHDDNQAHGLAFSVRKGVKIPPSLRNIYKEMATEYPGFVVPTHGDLTAWAEHGVLLLNTALTVRAHNAASHSTFGWDAFTGAALQAVLSQSPKGVVLMAWGAHAQKMIATLDTKRHLVLKSGHPSPLSARLFFGNDHFKKSNEWLRERYGKDGGVDWKSFGAQK